MKKIMEAKENSYVSVYIDFCDISKENRGQMMEAADKFLETVSEILE